MRVPLLLLICLFPALMPAEERPILAAALWRVPETSNVCCPIASGRPSSLYEKPLPTLGGNVFDATDLAKSFDLEMPSGALALFSGQTSRLFLHSTPADIEKMDAVFREIHSSGAPRARTLSLRLERAAADGKPLVSEEFSGVFMEGRETFFVRNAGGESLTKLEIDAADAGMLKLSVETCFQRETGEMTRVAWRGGMELEPEISRRPLCEFPEPDGCSLKLTLSLTNPADPLMRHPGTDSGRLPPSEANPVAWQWNPLPVFTASPDAEREEALLYAPGLRLLLDGANAPPLDPFFSPEAAVTLTGPPDALEDVTAELRREKLPLDQGDAVLYSRGSGLLYAWVNKAAQNILKTFSAEESPPGGAFLLSVRCDDHAFWRCGGMANQEIFHAASEDTSLEGALTLEEFSRSARAKLSLQRLSIPGGETWTWTGETGVPLNPAEAFPFVSHRRVLPEQEPVVRELKISAKFESGDVLPFLRIPERRAALLNEIKRQREKPGASE